MTVVSFPALTDGLRSGCVGSFPTDTVPALAVRPDRAEAIFDLKQRSSEKPLILMAASAEDLWPYTDGTPEERALWQTVARQYWPGALTLILPASSRLPPQVNPSNPTTIGLRVPDCDIARRVLAETGPLATTSANRSGDPPLTTPETIDRSFPQVLVLAPDEYPSSSASGLPSTVAKWVGDRWEILRSGALQLK
ncbi:MAG: L-threonylcarbamoyladenylate synthase [Cyanobacteria bacterium SID2]|nr:L-threonylcarbamoyladenylate synthase [Cyanobacteria bacterium SID2]MBP0002121.1 L-threonylcarbamoyladenylate synthase [Cyanobacteria bacterium SBC]